MFRRILAVVAIAGLAACGDYRASYDALRAKEHFWARKAAFQNLGDALRDDPSIEGAFSSKCPGCIPLAGAASEQGGQLSPQEQRLQALLDALNTNGHIWFERRADGSFWFPNAGGATRGGYRIALSFVHVVGGSTDIPECNGSEIDRNVAYWRCVEPLSGDWFVEYWSTNTSWIKICSDSRLREDAGPEVDCELLGFDDG